MGKKNTRKAFEALDETVDVDVELEKLGIDINMQLTELMDKCNGENGQRFRWLRYEKHDRWIAQARPQHPKSADYPNSTVEKMIKDPIGAGRTPEEAVKRLLLALNK